VTAATISIVSHGHSILIRHLLKDLSAQQQIDECRIVITLNLAGEEFDVADYPLLKLTVIRNECPKGFGANHNAAFEFCDSPWFIILNPDIRLPEPGTIRRLIAGTPASGDGIRAPKVGNSDGGVEDSIRLNLTPLSLMRRFLGKREPYSPDRNSRLGSPFYWVGGMCMVINSHVYREIHGFDERIFLYCEDYDICARTYLAGHTIEMMQNVTVIHDAQRDSHRSLKHLRWHLASLLKVWISSPFWRLAVVGQNYDEIEQQPKDAR
jgi:GT2 family glycosyltransferase